MYTHHDEESDTEEDASMEGLDDAYREGTELERAIARGDEAAVRRLIADPDTSFLLSEEVFKYEFIEKPGYPFDEEDADWNPSTGDVYESFDVIHLAIALDSTEILALLIKKLRSSPDRFARGEWYAFNYLLPLVENDREDLALLFLEEKACPKINQFIDGEGNLLHHACKLGWLAVLEKLNTMAEVSFTVLNAAKENVFTIADDAGQTEIFNKLLEYNRKRPSAFEKDTGGGKRVNIVQDLPLGRSKQARKDIELALRFERSFGSSFLPGLVEGMPLSMQAEEIRRMLPPGLEPAASTGEEESDVERAIDERVYSRGDPKSIADLHAIPSFDPRAPRSEMKSLIAFLPEDLSRSRKQLIERMHEKRVKKRRYAETTTAGASSLSSERGGDRKRMRESLTFLSAPSPLESELATDVTARLDQLNKALLSKSREALSDEFVVAHFRGLNFSRKYFKTSRKKNNFVDGALLYGIHSKMSYANAKVPLGKVLTLEEDRLLGRYDQQVRDLWRGLEASPAIKKSWGDKESSFDSAAISAQAHYTEVASKINRKKNKTRDIFDEEIWGAFQKSSTVQPILEQSRLKIKGTPLVSTGQTAKHAVRYALGSSFSPANKDTRSDPRIRNSGQAKHRKIGVIYITLHTVNEYRQASPSHVLGLVYEGKISIRPGLWEETEVSFPGGIAQEHVKRAMPACFPTFKYPWEVLNRETRKFYTQYYGLTCENYTDYKDRFNSTARPHDPGLELFAGPWTSEYEDRHGLSKEVFNACKVLVNWRNDEVREEQTSALTVVLKELNQVNVRLKRKKQAFQLETSKGCKTKKEIEGFLRASLRKLSPYRTIKDEIRAQLADHCSNLLFEEAKKLARDSKKHLVYQRPDGTFALVGAQSEREVAQDLRTRIMNKRKAINSESKAMSMTASPEYGVSALVFGSGAVEATAESALFADSSISHQR